MRVTTQMVNTSAAQAGLNIHTASLANYIQTSDSVTFYGFLKCNVACCIAFLESYLSLRQKLSL